MRTRFVALLGRDEASGHHRLQHNVGARWRLRRFELGPIGWRFRQAGENGGFAKREFRCWFAEIAARGSVDAVCPIAEIDAVEIEFRPLSAAARCGTRAPFRGDLAVHCLLAVEEEIARELLGQRRAALHGFAGAQVGEHARSTAMRSTPSCS